MADRPDNLAVALPVSALPNAASARALTAIVDFADNADAPDSAEAALIAMVDRLDIDAEPVMAGAERVATVERPDSADEPLVADSPAKAKMDEATNGTAETAV